MSAQSEALAFLRRELQDLRKRRLEPTRQTVIKRMIDRRNELEGVFNQIWQGIRLPSIPDVIGHFTNDGRFIPELTLHRHRVLVQITMTAAIIVKDQAGSVREARAEVDELADQFEHQAKALAQTLTALEDAASRADMQLPDFTWDVGEILSRSVRYSCDPHKAVCYEYGPGEQIAAAFGAYDLKYLPTTTEILAALAALAEEKPKPAGASVIVRVLNRQSNPPAEFIRALRLQLQDMERYTLTAALTLSHGDFARLAEVCLGLPARSVTDDQARKA